MDYKIVVTKDAEEDLDRFIQYLIFEKKSTQAARNVLDDYDATIECLKHVAGSLKLCENPRLRMQGYPYQFFESQISYDVSHCREHCFCR